MSELQEAIEALLESNVGGIKELLAEAVEAGVAEQSGPDNVQALRTVLYTIPRLGLPVSSTVTERLTHIFGLKRNQSNRLLDTIRDEYPSIFKQANRAVAADPSAKGIPKERRADMVLAYIFMQENHRKTMVAGYIKALEDGLAEDQRPTCLEASILKHWACEYDLGADSANPGKIPFEDADICPDTIMLFPSVTAPFFASIQPLALRYKLIELGDAIIAAIAEDAGEWENPALPAAAWALAALTDNHLFLTSVMVVAPQYITEVDGPQHSGGDTPYVELRDELLATAEQHSSPHLIALSALRIQEYLEGIRRTYDTSFINDCRSELDHCEELVMIRGLEEVAPMLRDVAHIREGVERLVDGGKLAGIAVKSDHIVSRLDGFAALYEKHKAVGPSVTLAAFNKLVKSEVRTYHTYISEGLDAIDHASMLRGEIVMSGKPWAEQDKLIAECAAAVAGSLEQWNALNEGAKNAPDYNKLYKAEAPQKVSTKPEPPQPAPDASGDLAKAQEELAAEKARVAKLELSLEQSAGRVDDLRQENASYRKQVDSLKLSLAGIPKGSEQQEALCSDTQQWVEELAAKGSAHDVLKVMELFYSDRLVILPSAYEAASPHLSSIPAPALLERLKALATSGLDVVRETGQIIDCQDLVPGEVAVQESETVRNNGKFKKLRTFPYNGGRHTFFPHLHLNRAHRIYFDYMPEDRERFVIAYVGQHMPSEKSPTI